MGLECEWRHARKGWGENLGILKNTSVGDKMSNWESAVEPPLPRWGWSAAMVTRRTLDQNNSMSPSPAHLSRTTNINPFENKVWEIYFYKEVCSFVHWSSSLLLTMFPFIFVLCLCMSLYNMNCYVYAVF